MNPWERTDLTIEETPEQATTAQTMPWERDLEIEEPRGANIGGVVRNIANATPFGGTWADEIEAAYRATRQKLKDASPIVWKNSGKSWDELYNMYKKNAEESLQGNLKNTDYGRALNIGTNIAENMALATLTNGATLMPNVSGLQGLIEGFGEGNDWRERTENAALQGTINTFVPAALNRILPTKSVQKSLMAQLAKRPLETTSADSKVLETLTARALQQGTTPDQIIANQVSKGYRENLLGNMTRAGVGEDVFRGTVMKNMAELRRPGYAEYIGKQIEDVLPGWGKKFAKEVENIETKTLGEDIFEKADPRKIVKTAVNNIMKGASSAERDLASNVMENAIATQGVAKKTLGALKAKPVSTGSGSIWNLLRRAASPFRNIKDYGTMRALTVRTPNYIPSNIAEKIMNFYTPNSIRGALDALTEYWQESTLK